VTGILFSVPLTSEVPDLTALLRTPVPGDAPRALIGRRDSATDHLSALQTEFAGQPQLYFFHATLNVLIRRGIDSDVAYRQFRLLWARHCDDLLKGLNARWLVAACDTIMDCALEPYECAVACAASTFLNTVKLYETERLSYGPAQFDLSGMESPSPLFDGMTSFAVGQGDMILNLRKRTEAVCRSGGDSIAASIMRELLQRVDRADTVFSRLAAVHTNMATRWVAPTASST
jgi:hypothetical protein